MVQEFGSRLLRQLENEMALVISLDLQSGLLLKLKFIAYE